MHQLTILAALALPPIQLAPAAPAPDKTATEPPTRGPSAAPPSAAPGAAPDAAGPDAPPDAAPADAAPADTPPPGPGAAPSDAPPDGPTDMPAPASEEDMRSESGKEVTHLAEDYLPPFPSDDMELSMVLEQALTDNLDLASNAVDVDISEATVLAALGAYDVFLTAGLNGSVTETPQRGSQFTFSLGQRTIGGNVGFNKKIQTGGTVGLTLNANRSLSDQPVNFFDTTAGSTTLSSYAITPTLTVSHPLLRGAGLRVNRADINRAKVATSSAEAQRQVLAEGIVRDLVSAYWDLLFAHRDLENKRRSVALAQRQLERTRALVSAGRLSPVDAKAVEQALAARESDVITAEGALLDSSLNLRTLMGQQFADRDTLGVLPRTDPVVKARAVDTRAEIDKALSNNPQIRQLQLGIASRRIDEVVAANARLPQLDVSGSFTPQGRSVDTVPNAGTGDPGSQGGWGEAFRNIFSDNVRGNGLLADWTLTGAITLTWDIQNRGPKGQHQQAMLQIDKAQIGLEQARQQIAASVIRAANGLRTASKVMDVSEISMDLARENLEAEQARFDVGRSTNFDVLERLDELDTAEANALNAQISYLKALVQLQALNGEILPAYGMDAS